VVHVVLRLSMGLLVVVLLRPVFLAFVVVWLRAAATFTSGHRDVGGGVAAYVGARCRS
jgi:hypothetical protein